MKTPRNYNCKDEELVVVCDYVQTSLQRDLSDFTAFATKFNQHYLADFQGKIQAIRQIVFPYDKTNELKIVTACLYAGMDELINFLDRLEGYIKLSKNAVPISATDFGTFALKKKIRSRDAEGTLKELQQVISNVEKYREPLEEQGLSHKAMEQLSAAFDEINTGNQKQYEIVSSRRILTVENINMLNALYAQMMEICGIGKILYKKSQKEKLPDYTFVYLKKKVRIA